MKTTLTATLTTGTALRGAWFQTGSAQTVVIIVTGVEGNLTNNPFLTTLGRTLNQANIDLMVAHTRDAFNQVSVPNARTGQLETYGAWSEDFRQTDEDVAAYLRVALGADYRHIVLGGHSLGANKVIHYLAAHPKSPVDKFLLLSPVNVDRLRDSISGAQRTTIRRYRRAGQGMRRLPFRLFGWLSGTADTGAQWLTNQTLNNVHLEPRADFRQVAAIRHTGALVIGERDRFTRGNPVAYLQNINRHFRAAAQNDLRFIAATGHIYRHHEQDLADQVVALVRQWRLNEKENEHAS